MISLKNLDKEMKEEDYIEKLITNRLEELNNEEPPAGHFDRFEARLRAESRKKVISWQKVWQIAAAVVFVLLAGNQVRLWMAPDEKQVITLAGISPEYAEVEYFYTRSIQDGIATWNDLARTGLVPEEENRIMQEEFKEFERRFEEIQKEFEAHPQDERVIQAMLEYYQAKLSVITMIVNKLQEVKQYKESSHETKL